MTDGDKLYDLATLHEGEKYILGSIAPKNDPLYEGPWDCAEFASWLVFQLSGKLYGCADNSGNPSGADAYSGFWARDARKLGIIITVAQAASTRGAAVIRVAGPDLIGHVVISDGKGGTIEAHSSKMGVIHSSLSFRRWDFGVLIPWLTYFENEGTQIKKPGKIYRYEIPVKYEKKVEEIQKALGIRPDGYFGPKTFNAVKGFQRNSGILADGEVGQITAAKMGITL